MWSARALATPAATVPTPTSETSFHRDRRVRVDVLQVEDQLGQILDRVDVVVRAAARSARRPGSSDGPWSYLGHFRPYWVRHTCPPSAGLSAPCAYLDLHHVGVDEDTPVVNAEAARGEPALIAERWSARRTIGWKRSGFILFAALGSVFLTCRRSRSWRSPSVSCASFRDRAEGSMGAPSRRLNDLPAAGSTSSSGNRRAAELLRRLHAQEPPHGLEGVLTCSFNEPRVIRGSDRPPIRRTAPVLERGDRVRGSRRASRRAGGMRTRRRRRGRCDRPAHRRRRRRGGSPPPGRPPAGRRPRSWSTCRRSTFVTNADESPTACEESARPQ